MGKTVAIALSITILLATLVYFLRGHLRQGIEQWELEDELNVDILESVLLYVASNNESGMGERAAVYCVVIGTKDPSTELLFRLKRHQSTFRPISECEVGPRPARSTSTSSEGLLVYESHGVWDPVSKNRGLLFNITKIERRADRAIVWGGYYEASKSASGHEFVLERQNGLWRIINDKQIWISSIWYRDFRLASAAVTQGQ